MARRSQTTPRAADLTLPTWLRETDTYSRGLYDLDDASLGMVMTLSYYLGEAFVRTHGLRWSVGRNDTAEQGQPVVGPFDRGMELAAILVTENLFRAVIEGEDIDRLRTAVATWSNFLPPSA